MKVIISLQSQADTMRWPDFLLDFMETTPCYPHKFKWRRSVNFDPLVNDFDVAEFEFEDDEHTSNLFLKLVVCGFSARLE